MLSFFVLFIFNNKLLINYIIKAINDKKLGKPKGSDTYYYFKDGKIKEE